MDDFRATFIRRKPTILMERIDYIFVSSAIRQNILSLDIMPAFVSDHATPSIVFNFISLIPGKGYWKFNKLLLEDETFVALIIDTIGEVFVNMKDLNMTLKWDLLKLAIWDKAILRGIQIANSRNNKIAALKRALKIILKPGIVNLILISSMTMTPISRIFKWNWKNWLGNAQILFIQCQSSNNSTQ